MPENQKRVVPIFFRLSSELDLLLRNKATREERSLAQQLRYLIRESLEDENAASLDNQKKQKSSI